MNIRHLVSAGAVAGALVLAAPAVAGGDNNSGKPMGPCPKGYILAFDPFNVSGTDANDNDMVCVRTTSSGDVFTDDRV
jgi:hypothetical protein